MTKKLKLLLLSLAAVLPIGIAVLVHNSNTFVAGATCTHAHLNNNS